MDKIKNTALNVLKNSDKLDAETQNLIAQAISKSIEEAIKQINPHR